MGKLEGKIAIITGTAQGIGRTAVKVFVDEGAKVAMFDIDDKGMEETAALAGGSDNVIALHTDITSEKNVIESVKKVIDTFGTIDCLYNNAAYNRDFKSALDTSEEDWDTELAVTLKGSFFCSKHVLPHMIKKGSGSIILTGSWLSVQGYEDYCAYATAKGGVLQLMRSLAVDYSREGVRSNCICPGATDTPSLAGIKDDPEFYKGVRGMTLSGRIAQPEDVAKVAVFLASDDSEYVTGAVIPVDGGAGARLGLTPVD